MQCQRCCYFTNTKISVQMEPASKYNLKTVPLFHATQKKFCFSFKRIFSSKKKSNSQNIPGCVLLLCQFYHMCLSHEKIHNSVIYQTFMKFSCKVWFADFVLIFEGTQLVKVWEIMRSCLRDVKKLTSTPEGLGWHMPCWCTK